LRVVGYELRIEGIQGAPTSRSVLSSGRKVGAVGRTKRSVPAKIEQQADTLRLVRPTSLLFGVQKLNGAQRNGLLFGVQKLNGAQRSGLLFGVQKLNGAQRNGLLQTVKAKDRCA